MPTSAAGFLGNTVGEAAGFAAGVAVSPALAPLLRALENETWSQYPDAPLDALLLAQAVAEGKLPKDGDTYAEASYTGISNARFDSLVLFMQNGPGVSAGAELVRRGLISSSQWPDVLSRAGLEPEWVKAYLATDNQGLHFWQQFMSPADVALAVIRNNMANGNAEYGPLAQEGLPITPGKVPQNPVSSIDPYAEMMLAGIDPERAKVLVDNVGLPPGVIEGLRMLNRGIITEGDFALLIAQSDARLAWGPAIMALRWNVLTVHEGAELYLRGWIDQATFYTIAAKDGYQQTEAEQIYQSLGRGIPNHQVTTGLARGGVFDGPIDQIPQDYLWQYERASLRPEVYNLEYANRYTLPGYFVIKAILAAGGLTVDEATTIFEQEGWPPDLAAKAAKALAPTTTGSTDTHVKSSQTSLVTATRKAYVGGAATRPTASTALTAAGVSTETQNQLFHLWDAQRTVEQSTGPVIAPPTGG